ncbi:hypothetical protein P5673_019564, partial [Acropora cervicornis]
MDVPAGEPPRACKDSSSLVAVPSTKRIIRPDELPG